MIFDYFDNLINLKIKFLVKNLNNLYINFLLNQIFFHEDNNRFFNDDFNFKNGSYISKYSQNFINLSKIGKIVLLEEVLKLVKNCIN